MVFTQWSVLFIHRKFSNESDLFFNVFSFIWVGFIQKVFIYISPIFSMWCHILWFNIQLDVDSIAVVTVYEKLCKRFMSGMISSTRWLFSLWLYIGRPSQVLCLLPESFNIHMVWCNCKNEPHCFQTKVYLCIWTFFSSSGAERAGTKNKQPPWLNWTSGGVSSVPNKYSQLYNSDKLALCRSVKS